MPTSRNHSKKSPVPLCPPVSLCVKAFAFAFDLPAPAKLPVQQLLILALAAVALHSQTAPDSTKVPTFQTKALVPTDNQFQRRARLLQSLWRDAHSPPIGEHRGRPLGSRLAMPFAEDPLSNYLTDTIRSVVRREVLDPVA